LKPIVRENNKISELRNYAAIRAFVAKTDRLLARWFSRWNFAALVVGTRMGFVAPLKELVQVECWG